jgi:two-component system NtrC family response regulator
MAASGQFRQDLLFRIQSFVIQLPPLRARALDIKEIAIDYMTKMCEKQGNETKGFSPDFFEILADYDWPGNIRELINVMETVHTVARFEPTIFPMHLPASIRAHHARKLVSGKNVHHAKQEALDPPAGALPTLQEVRDKAVERVEKQYLSDLMLHAGGDIQQACRLSGLSQSRLYYLLKKYLIQR